MEMCQEQPQVHKVLLTFVIKRIFEKLAPNDYFSFFTLRSGKRAYQNIPLEMKKFNTNIKRRYLRDQTVSQKPSSKPSQEPSEELSRALISVSQDAKSLIPESRVKKGDQEYSGPQKYIVVIVGDQKQDLGEFESYLDEQLREEEFKNCKSEINLVSTSSMLNF
jgi:hypothetical protein